MNDKKTLERIEKRLNAIWFDMLLFFVIILSFMVSKINMSLIIAIVIAVILIELSEFYEMKKIKNEYL